MDVSGICAVKEGIEAVSSTPESVCLFLENIFGYEREVSHGVPKLVQVGIGISSFFALMGSWTFFSGVSGGKTCRKEDKDMFDQTAKTGGWIAAAGILGLYGMSHLYEEKTETIRQDPLPPERVLRCLNESSPAERTGYFMVMGCELLKAQPFLTSDEIVVPDALNRPEKSKKVTSGFDWGKHFSENFKIAYDGAYQFYFNRRDTMGLHYLMQSQKLSREMSEAVRLSKDLWIQTRHTQRERE